MIWNVLGGSIRSGKGFSSGTFHEGGWDTTSADNSTTFTMELDPNDNNDGTEVYCAKVTVEKIPLSDSKTVGTLITSRGYNTCDVDSARAVERGLETYYDY